MARIRKSRALTAHFIHAKTEQVLHLLLESGSGKICGRGWKSDRMDGSGEICPPGPWCIMLMWSRLSEREPEHLTGLTKRNVTGWISHPVRGGVYVGTLY